MTLKTVSAPGCKEPWNKVLDPPGTALTPGDTCSTTSASTTEVQWLGGLVRWTRQWTWPLGECPIWPISDAPLIERPCQDALL